MIHTNLYLLSPSARAYDVNSVVRIKYAIYFSKINIFKQSAQDSTSLFSLLCKSYTYFIALA